METLNILIDQPDDFDKVLKDSLPECGDLVVITKHDAMQSGAAGVMITFTVKLPDGTFKRVQAVTSMKLFRSVTQIFLGTYDERGFPLEGVGGATVFDDPEINP